jgi:hypothetical protein
LIKKFFLVIAASFALAGCVDRISTLGSAYYPDTVGFHTISRSDTGFMQFSDTMRPFVTYLGLDYNLTNYSPLMIIGKVLPQNPMGSNENLESWGLMKFNNISSDSVGMIVGVRLLLKDLNYMYGDLSNSQENFQVWTETKYKVSDSTNPLTNPLTIADLNSPPVGTIDTLFNDTADHVLVIPLNSNFQFANLAVPSLAFVVTPNQPLYTSSNPEMTNARGFGTTDNGGNDLSSVEQLQIALNNGDTIYESPTLDEHYVIDNSMSLKSQNEFTLRGGTGAREHITFNLMRPGDTAKLTQFTTVNNADLILFEDQANSRQSDLTIDTAGPAIVQITGVGDTATSLVGFGWRDTVNGNVRVHFQIRGLIENWLRSPVNNFGLDLRSGYVTRLIPGPGGVNIGVEDNTLNRWTFYGPNYPDATKHPQLILTYSNLH